MNLEELKTKWDYNPKDGFFTWKVKTNPKVVIGSEVGGTRNGYIVLSHDGKLLEAHRVAWAFVHGEWPKYHIDHINGIRDDNRIENLRDVPQAVNRLNLHKTYSNSGVLGVHKKGTRFMAQFKSKYLGMFATAEEAGEKYKNEKAKFEIYNRYEE